ncbi:Selenide, water dikinase 1 [Cichlidogyrus casuarinus]|uniref:Selenide, water dikinase 1 n=1 Tax=Cichlidogyrus casuarinus TaxID=1844966 RepID=A0ABD2QLA3_9PLAT
MLANFSPLLRRSLPTVYRGFSSKARSITGSFNPTDHGLSKDFPVELDCCVVPLKTHPNLSLIQTTDFFYALVDDPYTMGRITCCNVLSDMYAMGVTEVDNMLLLLGVPTSMKPDERMVSNKLIMEGFRDCAAEAGTFIRGGQTVQNPWLLIGGVATSICDFSQFIMPDQIKPGYKLVLTKPLGTQAAVNCYQWMLDGKLFWTEKLQPANVTEAQLHRVFESATQSMSRLNLTGAKLMHSFDSGGATDVTGFGVKGHAENLVKVQKANVEFVFERLPLLKGTMQLAQTLDDRFGLFQGLCPETSGGLLIGLPADKADAFCQELEASTGNPAWVVGSVREAEKKSVAPINHESIDFFEV